MAEADLWFALEKVSLSLKDAAVLLRANHHGVGYEAAAVLAYKEKSQMKKKQLTVKKNVESVTSDDHITFTTLTGHGFFVVHYQTIKHNVTGSGITIWLCVSSKEIDPTQLFTRHMLDIQ